MEMVKVRDYFPKFDHDISIFEWQTVILRFHLSKEYKILIPSRFVPYYPFRSLEDVQP